MKTLVTETFKNALSVLDDLNSANASNLLLVALVRNKDDISEIKFSVPLSKDAAKKMKISFTAKIEEKKSFAANENLRFFAAGILTLNDASAIFMTHEEWKAFKQMKIPSGKLIQADQGLSKKGLELLDIIF